MIQLYHGSTAAVSTRFGLTETFDTTSGVLQGDTLSPHLLILLVDYILRQSHVDEDGFTLKPANGRRHPAVTLNAVAYADDVAIAVLMEVASSRPDHLPKLSAANSFELSLLGKSHFWWLSSRRRKCYSDFLRQCAGDIEADHTDSGITMECADRNRE